jgi:hypothetical protein
VRHHINNLRDAGLGGVVRFEKWRGKSRKYYGANTTGLSYPLLESTNPAMWEIIDTVKQQMGAAFAILTDEYDDVTEQMQLCEHCQNAR